MKLRRFDGPYNKYGDRCLCCKHLIGVRYFEEINEYKPCCKAYEKGIPPELWSSFEEHKPVNGYVFEEK